MSGRDMHSNKNYNKICILLEYINIVTKITMFLFKNTASHTYFIKKDYYNYNILTCNLIQ